MDDYKEIFKRDLDRLTYLYIKANTQSKKNRIAYDLIAFENMYNYFDEDMKFPWSDDDYLIDFRLDIAYGLMNNILDNKFFLLDIAENSFDIFLENNFSIYCDYRKKLHKLEEKKLQEYIINFYNMIDDSLKKGFIDKLNNEEIFVNNNLKENIGVFFPFELLKKNIVLFVSGENMCVDEARVLVHELGHDFEYQNAYKCGLTNIWDKNARTIYVEVSSCFFEYAFINYLIDNNIYREDAMILKRRYLNQIFEFLSYILIIFSQSKIFIDYEFNVKLQNDEMVEFANSLLEEMNSDDNLYKLGDKLNFRSAFVYGIGKLLGIYVHEAYKDNPKEFLSNFKKVLLEYKDTDIKAFEYLGITSDDLIKGDVLRKTLSQCR